MSLLQNAEVWQLLLETLLGKNVSMKLCLRCPEARPVQFVYSLFFWLDLGVLEVAAAAGVEDWGFIV